MKKAPKNRTLTTSVPGDVFDKMNTKLKNSFAVGGRSIGPTITKNLNLSQAIRNLGPGSRRVEMSVQGTSRPPYIFTAKVERNMGANELTLTPCTDTLGRMERRWLGDDLIESGAVEKKVSKRKPTYRNKSPARARAA